MRIVFLGTPGFAVASLRALFQAGHDIAAVVTAPDRPAGRGRQLSSSAVKEFALSNGLKVLQPEKLKDPEFVHELQELRADVHIVVAFRMLPEIVWNMPPLGTYNLHASLLPRYRGAAPINRAIMQGDTVTGVTVFKLKHEIDSGSILLQEAVEIGAATNAGELHDVLMERGAALLVTAVQLLEKYKSEKRAPEFLVQREDEVTHAPKLFREDCEISWGNPTKTVYNHIRGLSPAPGAFTFLVAEGSAPLQMKVLKAGIATGGGVASEGTVNTDNSNFLMIRCADGWLDVQELQLEGKRRMGVRELLRGFSVPDGARVGKHGMQP